MLRLKTLKNLISKYRGRLLLTYSLFFIEMTGALLRPFFLGHAINDLIKGSYTGLIMLCIVHAGWLIIGTIRHMYDTRTYSGIYVSLVTKFLSKKRHRNDVSKLSAHSTLAREVIDFLEFDLVYIVEALFNIIGSLVMLFFYEASLVIMCLSILLPVSVISYKYGKKMMRLNKYKNDELEQQVDVISTGDRTTVHKHYNNLRKWQIRISDQEALNFGVMEILVMIVIALSLLIIYKISGTTVLAGSIVGVYTYVLKFVSGLDTIPYTVQRLTSLHDITKRIETYNEKEEMLDKVKILEHANSIKEVA